MNYCMICECGPVCEFEEDPDLFLRIVQTDEVNAQVQRAHGFPVTAKIYRKLAYLAYILAVFGWLGCGTHRPPKAYLVELVHAEWPEQYVSECVSVHSCAAENMAAKQGQIRR
jgi:hypothetical protein